MKPVLVPTTDVNSETGLLLAWHAKDRSEVQEGETIAEIETSKTIFDVPAPESGFLLHAAREGTEVRLGGRRGPAVAPGWAGAREVAPRRGVGEGNIAVWYETRTSSYDYNNRSE